MYNVFVSVINRGAYRLGDMLERIKTYAAEGKLTLAEMAALEKLAREKANIQSETNVLEMLLEHETRIRALEANTNVNTPEVETVPGFVVGKTYLRGDKVTFEGKVFECVAPEGAVCVWSPADYAAYWQEV